MPPLRDHGRTVTSPQDVSIALGQRLATSAMSLARSQAEPDASVVVLVGMARGDRVALGLARARCEAAFDQDVSDVAARQAAALLTAALEVGGP
jgi:hypothetical protein